jgi:hypothetical protein
MICRVVLRRKSCLDEILLWRFIGTKRAYRPAAATRIVSELGL